jgi:hypothetical protein
MKIIPRPAWVLAAAMGIAVAALVFYAVTQEYALEFAPLFLVGGFLLVTFVVFFLLLGYIYADAKRRGMRPVLWLLLAFFIPNAIGILLYFILREPLLVACPRCGAGTKAAFPFCPACGAGLANTCPSCRSAIESGWTHCARCGAQLSPA